MKYRKPIISGNWKMNTDLESGTLLATEIAESLNQKESCDVVIFPPFPYLQAVGSVIADTSIILGAQNVWFAQEGAFTGEVSCAQLKDIGASMVIIGHSERRQVLGESDDLIHQKIHSALGGGLDITFCVGETIEERTEGRTLDVVLHQIDSGLKGVSEAQMEKIVIAYEPVWAIGTGKTATPKDAQEAHAAIRKQLATLFNQQISESTRIQYGGSVKPDNAAALFACQDIDGALVGGASLSAASFTAIIVAANQT